jgi:3-oxoacyl-[acyl-carrier protein] reductase
LVLPEHGYRVVVNDRASGPQAEEVVATIAAAGGEAVAIKADITVVDVVATELGVAAASVDQMYQPAL